MELWICTDLGILGPGRLCIIIRLCPCPVAECAPVQRVRNPSQVNAYDVPQLVCADKIKHYIILQNCHHGQCTSSTNKDITLSYITTERP